MADALFVQQPSVSYSAAEYRRLVSAMYRGDTLGGVVEGMALTTSGLNFNIAPGTCVVYDGAGGHYFCYFDTIQTGPIPAQVSGSRTDSVFVQVNDPGDGQAVVGRVAGPLTGANRIGLGSMTVNTAGAFASRTGRALAKQVGHRGPLLFTRATRDSVEGILGEEGLETDTWLRYIHDGAAWCIAPGQRIAGVDFTDFTKRSYAAGWLRIGEISGADSTVTFDRPRSLPKHGFRYTLTVKPFTSGNQHGELVSATLFAYSPASGPVGSPVTGNVHGLFGDAYNATMSIEQFFPGTDLVMGSARSAASLCVAGACPTGLVQFGNGHLSIESA